MAYIGNQPTLGQYRKLDDISGSFNGSLTAFTMQVGSTNVSAGSAFQLLISLGGVIQNPGTDFTVSGSTITFTTAPAASLSFFGILMGQPLNTATPGDSTVTGAKIVDGTITGGKLAAAFNYDSGLLFLDDTNNRVGIGTASPLTEVQIGPDGANGDIDSGYRTLSIADTTNGAQLQLRGLSPKLFFDSSGGGNGEIYMDGTALAVFSGTPNTPGTERARIDNSGRFLVGTTSTSNTCTAVFTGRNDSSTANPVIRLQPATTAPSSGNTLGNISFSSNGTSAFEAAAWITALRDGGTWTAGSSHPGRLEFGTTPDGSASPVLKLRILANGMQASFSTDQVYEGRTSVAASSTASIFRGWHSSTGVGTGGTNSIRIQTNGNLQNTNNSYGSISDAKLKENIVDASSQWDDLKAIQIRKYNFKEETGHETFTQIGVIAQEVELVSPGLVTESPDTDAEGNDLSTVTKSVNYSVLYMKAVKALQEAMERIETLEQRLNDAGIS